MSRKRLFQIQSHAQDFSIAWHFGIRAQFAKTQRHFNAAKYTSYSSTHQHHVLRTNVGLRAPTKCGTDETAAKQSHSAAHVTNTPVPEINSGIRRKDDTPVVFTNYSNTEICYSSTVPNTLTTRQLLLQCTLCNKCNNAKNH